MLNAIDKHKYEMRSDTIEDVKSSSVIENLLMLPDDVVWKIIRNSVSNNSVLPEACGSITSTAFWPKWSGKGILEENGVERDYIEPDVFIRFSNFDLIIEAKRTDKEQQTVNQWLNEIVAYRNKYSCERRKVYLLALGGNLKDLHFGPYNDQIKNRWNICEDEYSNIQTCCYRTTWLSLLLSVDAMYKFMMRSEHSNSLERIFKQIILAFNINGIYHVNWFQNSVMEPILPDAILIKNTIKWNKK